ncbi:response regulator [Desulfococcaceae bacterium HSG7]|nr:response regulator [Desulfococcaceae bacterium HSG9]MDM8553898.1 response regulator [Desulfococcaceae bacterium HSG7]
MNPETIETILLVDDDDALLEVLSEYFKLKGRYRIITASNGMDALSIIKGETVNCCVTDINMPHMGGLELAEQIRKIDNTIPVIIMTGFPSLTNSIKTLQNGVVDFLVKPVQFDQIELSIQRVFQQRKLFIENILYKKEAESKAKLEKLNRELHLKVNELNILNRIMSDLTETSSGSDVFRRVTEMTITLTPATEARFYIINEASKHPFEVTSAFKQPADHHNSISHKISKPATSSDSKNISDRNEQRSVLNEFLQTIAADGIPLLVAENHAPIQLPTGICSFIAVPLSIQEKVFGLLTAAIKNDNKFFSPKDLYYTKFMLKRAAYVIENWALYENIYENLLSTLYALVNALEARDSYTQQHSIRVAALSTVLGKEMNLTSEELDILNVAGRLHDIGKIGVRDDILLKKGSLTSEEILEIEKHPLTGANIIEQLGLWEREQIIIKHHHERFDGKGYPDGLQRNNIPFLARIMAVADACDAMASDRVYRKGLPSDGVVEIISEEAGLQFDPDVVNVFKKVYHQGSLKLYLPGKK